MFCALNNGGGADEIETHYTYGQVIQRAVGVVFQEEVLEFKLERAATAGLQPPVAFGAVVVGHRVVGRCEHPCGSGEIASTACRGTQWVKKHALFILQDKPWLKHPSDTPLSTISSAGVGALDRTHAKQELYHGTINLKPVAFRDKNSLCSPGWPPTWNPSASASCLWDHRGSPPPHLCSTLKHQKAGSHLKLGFTLMCFPFSRQDE